ncbi:MAG TPA: fibronectin type III domain-containing protein [Candidatus Binatia bacterium]|nr:fibronectin type III domain-containing protein [Candidatus Binatia bacterium]
MFALAGLAALAPSLAMAVSLPPTSVPLAWDASTDPTVVGYHLYYGVVSGTYTNMIDTGPATSWIVTNLVQGTTYYFAVTSYNAAGLESPYSGEVSYTIPAAPPALPPTLDPLVDITINENAGSQIVNLTGISSGATNQTQTLTVSAFSTVPSLIPNPTVTYASPNSTGTLTFAPVNNAFGSAIITVMVDNGGTVSNTIIRSFNVAVNQVVTQSPLTNAVILPNASFKWTINPPFTNGDKLAFSVDPGAPTGASIVKWRGVYSLVWMPSTAQASTTNLISVRITDNTTPALSTNQLLQVIVLDYANVSAGRIALQAGQNGTVPVYLSASDGVSNFVFSVTWPSNRFTNPTLLNAVAGIASSSLQNQNTNLLITVQAAAGQALLTTNPVLQLSFQTVSTQSSAFVSLPVRTLSAVRPTGVPFTNCTAGCGRVVVVKDLPLLESLQATNGARSLAVYGRVGTNYQVQYKTSLTAGGSWSPLLTYGHTNVAQTLSIGSSSPLILYRLLQQ